MTTLQIPATTTGKCMTKNKKEKAMGKKRSGMTVEEHLHYASAIKEINNALGCLSSVCGTKFGWSHITHKNATRAIRVLGKLRSSLDDEYHKLPAEEGFIKHGHVYYK